MKDATIKIEINMTIGVENLDALKELNNALYDAQYSGATRYSAEAFKVIDAIRGHLFKTMDWIEAPKCPLCNKKLTRYEITAEPDVKRFICLSCDNIIRRDGTTLLVEDKAEVK